MKYRHLVFVFLSAALLVSCGKDNPNPTPQPEPGGGGGSQPALILSQDFTKGLGSFTKGGPDKDIWIFDSNNKKYGAQATGKDAKKPVESWLVSPEIDLTQYKEAHLYFNHAFGYAYNKDTKTGADLANLLYIKVSLDGGTTWVKRAIPKWLVAHSYFELAQSGDISLTEFKGKKIKFAFVYQSTDEFAPTWEITDVTVSVNPLDVLPDDAGDKYKAVAKGMMEMPQITDENNFYVHTTILRFDRVRNYSFSYNPEARVANWVAYPLYEEFSRNKKSTKVPRYDSVVSTNKAWASDPYVSTPNVSSGGSYEWSSKSYSRGHQLPSADRQGGAMANIQTFYTSNVTPQNTDFNGGIWEKLETAVRNWASESDTLYVVTGCIADNTCETVKDHDGQAVAVPKAYYKALLRLKGGNYIAAGFYLKHENTTKEYKEFAMSVKDLETKTGMTFFVNLPTDKAAAIKAEDPKKNNFWKLN